MSEVTVTRLTHVKVGLALHRLRDGEGRSLLLLHGLGEASPTEVPAWAQSWSGPVHALDFTGHGMSDLPAGGGYTAEVLMGDASTAVDHLGPVTVVGRGLGAWIALLLAGARPGEVVGSVLADGPGLAGGGSTPTSQTVIRFPWPPKAAPDPYAMVELSRDLRPPDYATAFARQAMQFSAAEYPITVAALARPPWLEAVVGEPGVQEASIEQALRDYGD
ncbi:MAG TPA: alpha/beta hydrolase [Acidimicrobiales bacterium]|nr:alpha/beta hydrolase [Acidimicrobiales bacterium]